MRNECYFNSYGTLNEANFPSEAQQIDKKLEIDPAPKPKKLLRNT